MSGPVRHLNPVRARLDHPVIDGDGHLIEFMPVIRELIAEDAGKDVAAKLDAVIYGSRAERELSRDERRVAGAARTFSNAASLWAGANPSFSDDTVVADAVRAELQ